MSRPLEYGVRWARLGRAHGAGLQAGPDGSTRLDGFPIGQCRRRGRS
ncbi:MAG: hypothetical protein ACM357_08160 [Gemmatimonadota bacterium]